VLSLFMLQSASRLSRGRVPLLTLSSVRCLVTSEAGAGVLLERPSRTAVATVASTAPFPRRRQHRTPTRSSSLLRMKSHSSDLAGSAPEVEVEMEEGGVGVSASSAASMSLAAKVPAAARGQDVLRQYLARTDHTHVARLSPDGFARWLEVDVLYFMCHNKAILLRVRAEAIRRHHSEQLDPCVLAAEVADAAYDASDEGRFIEAAVDSVHHLEQGILGIEAFLSKAPGSPAMHAKQDGAVVKLHAMRAGLPVAEEALRTSIAASRLWRLQEEARGALAGVRHAIGLQQAELDVSAANSTSGKHLVVAGGNYERACLAAVRQLLLEGLEEELQENTAVRHRAVGNSAGNNGVDATSEEAVAAAVAAAAAVRAAAAPKGRLLVVHNATLGASTGEFDCMVVRVNRPEDALRSDPPGDRDGVVRKAHHRSHGDTTNATFMAAGAAAGAAAAAAAAAAAVDTAKDSVAYPQLPPPPPPPAAEVLMVLEAKRNPDDLARGFKSQQKLLSWMAGEDYDPKDWTNRRHPKGRFLQGYHPMRLAFWLHSPGDGDGPEDGGGGGDGSGLREDESLGRWLMLTKDSFHLFKRVEDAEVKDDQVAAAAAAEGSSGSGGGDGNGGSGGGGGTGGTGGSGYFMERCWMATRPRALSGLEAKVREGSNPSPAWPSLA